MVIHFLFISQELVELRILLPFSLGYVISPFIHVTISIIISTLLNYLLFQARIFREVEVALLVKVIFASELHIIRLEVVNFRQDNLNKVIKPIHSYEILGKVLERVLAQCSLYLKKLFLLPLHKLLLRKLLVLNQQ